MGKRRNGGLWLTLITSNFLPLIDNALTQGKMKCRKADTGGGAESSGGSQTSLTSLPFFFCQVFIKRKCTDIKTPNSRGDFSCTGLLAEPYLFLSLASLFSWDFLGLSCDAGKPLIRIHSKAAFLGGVVKPGWGLRS